MPDRPQSFLRSVLSEPSGEGSTARFCTLLVVLFALGWETYLVARWGRLVGLGILAGWVSSVVGTLYGTNKLTAAIVARKRSCDGA